MSYSIPDLKNSSQKTEQDVKLSVKKSDNIGKWILFTFLFAPAPFYMCFSGCVGGQLIIPPVFAWIPILTIFSFYSPLRLLWQIIFSIPFVLIFITCAKYIDRQHKLTTAEKIFYKIIIYIIYWILIAFLWSLIPVELREFWLGQHA